MERKPSYEELQKRIKELEKEAVERKQAEEALRESEENFRALADNANDGIVIASGEGTHVYANKRADEITGYSISELLKTGFKELVHPDEWIKISERYKRRLVGEYVPRSYETAIIRKDRKELPVEVTGAKTVWHGQPAVIVIIRDIIERKRAELQIKASLKEKEALLKEIHHRVKNNLQIISSLLDMRIMRTDNQQVIDLFEDTRSKIHTMALIHTQLYRSERFDQINMGAHIRELVDYLSKIYAKRDVLITPVIERSDVCLSITQAIPCGLVLNELVSNAFKHAFQEGQEGTIEISLKREDHNKVFLKVKDNGTGIPEEIDIFNTNSLGFKLMRNTVQHQLMGSIHIEAGVGTTIIVKFRILEEEGSHA